MNKKVIIGSVAVIIIAGLIIFINQRSQTRILPDSTQTQTTSNKEGKKVAGYAGEVLAGSISPYLVFTKVDYDKALSSGKIIFIDFYANWCPICRAEAPSLKAGFDALQTDKVVGLRVNWNDSDTDKDEKALAAQFGITQQHTKIILKNGKEVARTLEEWDKDTFLTTINDLVSK